MLLASALASPKQLWHARVERSGLGKPTQRQLSSTSARNNRLQNSQNKTENCFSVFDHNLLMCGCEFNGDGDAVVAAIPPAIGQHPT